MKDKLVFVFLVVFVFSSVSCFAQSSSNDQRIVGTWIRTAEWGNVTVVFNANGSGTFTGIYNGQTEERTFTYGVSITGNIGFVFEGNSMNIFHSLSNDTLFFSPDSRTLVLNGGFFRKR